MRAARIAAGLVAVLSAAAVLTGCSGDGADLGADQRNFQAGTTVVIPAEQRKASVSMAGRTRSGQYLNVAQWRGHPVVVNAWASWCAPCRTEAPELVKAYRTLSPQGVTFVGVNVDDTGGAAAAFVRTYGIEYPSFVSTPSVILALKGAISPNALPTTVILDSEGRVAGQIVGPLRSQRLATMLRSIG